MEKLSQSFVSKITQFQKRLESFLDNDFDNKVEETERVQGLKLLVTKPWSAVFSQGLPEDHIDRAIVVFSRLAMLFRCRSFIRKSRWPVEGASLLSQRRNSVD